MINLECGWCKTVFVSEKWRHAKFCSVACGRMNRKLHVTHRFEIDNDEKFYWIGFLFGDGFVNGDANMLGITLSNLDGGSSVRLLTDFSFYMCGKDTVKQYGNTCTFKVHDEKLCNNLSHYGIVPKKTYLSTWKNIPEEFIYPFIAGYFDADGWFSCGKYRHISNGKYYDKPNFGICSYKKESLDRLLPFLSDCRPRLTKKSNQELFELTVSNNNGLLTLFKKMMAYGRLDRKWTKISNYLKSRGLI